MTAAQRIVRCGHSAPEYWEGKRHYGECTAGDQDSNRIVRCGGDGMSTAEYAIGTIAAAAFGAVLYTVVTGDSIVTALTGIIDRALNTTV